MSEFKKVLSTQSGMWCIWDKIIANGVNSYEEWESKFYNDDDLIKLIKKEKFVPININSNGNFEFLIRIGLEPKLTEREKQCVLVKSYEFLIYPSDNLLIVSGLEYIEENLNSNFIIEMPSKNTNYKVEIYLIDWKLEKQFVNNDGSPKSGALSDFVILLYEKNKNYKTDNAHIGLNTFLPPNTNE